MRLVRLDQGMFNMSLGEEAVEGSPRDLSSHHHQGTVALGDARVWMGANEGVVARRDTSDRLLAMFVEAYFFFLLSTMSSRASTIQGYGMI